jgi:hypothetical protein
VAFARFDQITAKAWAQAMRNGLERIDLDLSAISDRLVLSFERGVGIMNLVSLASDKRPRALPNH